MFKSKPKAAEGSFSEVRADLKTREGKKQFRQAHDEMFDKAVRVMEDVATDDLPFLLMTVDENDKEIDIKTTGIVVEEHLEAIFASIGSRLRIPDHIIQAVLGARRQVEARKKGENDNLDGLFAVLDRIFGDVEEPEGLDEFIEEKKKKDDCDCPACNLRRGLFGGMDKKPN